VLTHDEAAAFDRLKLDRDRRDYLAAHVVARLCLAEAWGRDRSGALPDDRAGWSLTHADGFVACAALAAPSGSIGIDAEPLSARPRLEMLAEAVGSPHEREQLDLVGLWVAKEAYLKARGEGFSGEAGFAVLRSIEATPANTVDEWAIIHLRDARTGAGARVWTRGEGDHVVAICAPGEEAPRLEARSPL
jgi:phosphopantetheinyl transferase